MKTIKLGLITFIAAIGLSSCSSDGDDSPKNEIDPLAEFNLVTNITANGHSLELYSEEKTGFTTGYNELFVRIKNTADDTYYANPEITWLPVMHMMSMNHSCPISELNITDDYDTVAKGYIVFQMPGNADEFWDITFTYTVAGQEFSVTETIDVTAPSDGKQTVSSFMGSDETRYVLAMVEPTDPEVAVNDIEALLYKMDSMMSFSHVENYSVALDPRMPGMGNHSSPNNEDLTYDAASKSYKGKLSLTMTGYWKLNLKLLNSTGEVLKGEDITEENEASSLYFELEF
ncbi:hypothetical protein QSE00_02380 [Arenibacter sp. M-2]|uniref:hypothetical protein n=1 Tax=unclassified Arenibacter TaxID=2615047 RepID=UPI000D7640C1|nr:MULTISPECIES: hypothetical protein [unclassified Arenibacter]MDL5510645.1 hypothetical protein [Arenibacter sp. M-2]PXX25124.1 hypothetical protein C7972_1131 [Arenibacter sp. ARW7G5Y1]